MAEGGARGRGEFPNALPSFSPVPVPFGFDGLLISTYGSTYEIVCPESVLNAFSEVPDAFNLGTLSPWKPVNLSSGGRQLAHIRNSGSTHFCWAYPLAHCSDNETKRSLDRAFERHNVSEELKSFLLVGGYVYSNSVGDNMEVVEVNCITPGDGLYFGTPKPLQRSALRGTQLEKDGRFQPITIGGLYDAGARYFCWITPKENVGVWNGERYWPMGAFAYQFENPEMDRYFPIIDPTDPSRNNFILNWRDIVDNGIGDQLPPSAVRRFRECLAPEYFSIYSRQESFASLDPPLLRSTSSTCGTVGSPMVDSDFLSMDSFSMDNSGSQDPPPYIECGQSPPPPSMDQPPPYSEILTLIPNSRQMLLSQSSSSSDLGNSLGSSLGSSLGREPTQEGFSRLHGYIIPNCIRCRSKRPVVLFFSCLHMVLCESCCNTNPPATCDFCQQAVLWIISFAQPTSYSRQTSGF